MTAGRLQLVCRATGDAMTIEDLRRRGYVISIARVVTEHIYAVPHLGKDSPPQFPFDAPHGIGAAEFFDSLAGKAIRACRGSVESSI